jgi:hypothetical protein
MSEHRRQVEDHERLRVSAERVLEEISQLFPPQCQREGGETKEKGKGRTLEFRYGTCVPLPAPSAAMTSPKALRLLLIAWVSLRRSLSLAAPLEESLSDPAKSWIHTPRLVSIEKRDRKGKGGRTTRFKHPSHASPVVLFTPLARNVKMECDREERSFIQVVATARRDCACWRREETWLGLVSGTACHIIKVCNSGRRRSTYW